MKLLHLADLHLDSPFKGLHKDISSVHPYLKDAPYIAFEKAVTLALDEAVDVVLLVGDIYNSRQQSIYAQHFFLQQLKRLEKQNIPVIMCHGNHDYIKEDGFALTYPSNVYIFAAHKPSTISLSLSGGETLAVHGFSYGQRWVHERIVNDYPQADPQATYNIGLLHASAEGVDTTQANYAPFSVPELLNKNYHYWALGHIHQPLVLHEEPRIQYAGTPQGRNRTEIGELGGWLVHLEAKQPTQSSFQTFSPIIWEQATLSCTSLKDINQLLEQLEGIKANYLKDGQAHNRSYLLSIQLTDAQALPRSLQKQIEEGELLAVLNQEEAQPPFVAIAKLSLQYHIEKEAFTYNQELDDSFKEAVAFFNEDENYQEVMELLFKHKTMQTWQKDLTEQEALKEAIIEQAEASLVQLFHLVEEEEADAN